MRRLIPQALQDIIKAARERGNQPDLTDVNLSNADLSRLDLSEVDLSGANLAGANLIETVLNDARLSGADLSGADLIGANLAQANLKGANLSRANLIGANMVETRLDEATLSRADLSGVNLNAGQLRRVNLDRAELIGCNLMGVNLHQAHLIGADLSGANLIKVDLREANLSGARLIGADLSKAHLGYTNLADVDLRQTLGLPLVIHHGPSTVDARTLYRSKGLIPEVFLREAGLPDDLIRHLATLGDETSHYLSCFISYASRDAALAGKLADDLQRQGVRCWHSPGALKANAPFSPTTEETIRVSDKLLLLFSEYSLTTEWIAAEVEAALQRERKLDQIVLFPIRLDEALLTSKADWLEPLQNNRNIHNFAEWRTPSAYQKSFERLLRHLRARHE